MNPSPEELEKLIHQTLRSLPDRRAPRSLETRVLAAIAARNALPWWKQSFAQWPLAARGLFLLLSCSLVVLMVAGWMSAGLDRPDLANTFSTEFAFVENVTTTLRAVAGLCMELVHKIPTVWLYGGLGCLAALYATVLGLGATAYRTLYVSR